MLSMCSWMERSSSVTESTVGSTSSTSRLARAPWLVDSYPAPSSNRICLDWRELPGSSIDGSLFGFFDLRERNGECVFCALERLPVRLPLGLPLVGPRRFAHE